MEYLNDIKQMLASSFHEFLQLSSQYLPNLVSALVLLLVGILLAGIAKWLIIRLSAGLDRIVNVVGITAVPILRNWPLGVILGWLAFWLLILFFLTAAVETLGLPGVADWLGKLIQNLPIYFIALLIVVGGILLGNYLRDKIQSGGRAAGLRQTAMLGTWSRILVITFSVIIALAQIGLDVSLLEKILLIMVTAVLGSIALAFGLGAGPALSNVISGRYVRKTYQAGQRVNISGIEGRILELLPTGVVLDTAGGRTFVPARMFDENVSVLLDNEDADAAQ